MKHFSWLIAAMLLVCSTQMTYADECNSNNCGSPCLEDCSFCDFDFCDVTYDFYVDYLYWELCRGGLNYDDGKYVSPGYSSGWRIGTNFNYDDWILSVEYTNICFDGSGGGNKHELDFQNVNIDLGYTIQFNCAPIELTPFVGAKLTWVEEKWDESYDNSMDIDAYGLRIGFATRYNLCNWTFCDNSVPLAFVSRASTGILNATYCHSDRDDECSYIPVHELFFGLDMSFSDIFCDTDASFQIGYEVQSWGFREFDSSSDAANLGMGGLVARFGVAY